MPYTALLLKAVYASDQLTGIANPQPLGRIRIINAEGIGHTDGQALGTTERGHDLLHLRSDGREGVCHPLSHIIGIQAPEQFLVLAGDPLGTNTYIADIAAAQLIAETAGSGLHDVLADMHP